MAKIKISWQNNKIAYSQIVDFVMVPMPLVQKSNKQNYIPIYDSQILLELEQILVLILNHIWFTVD